MSERVVEATDATISPDANWVAYRTPVGSFTDRDGDNQPGTVCLTIGLWSEMGSPSKIVVMVDP